MLVSLPVGRRLAEPKYEAKIEFARKLSVKQKQFGFNIKEHQQLTPYQDK